MWQERKMFQMGSVKRENVDEVEDDVIMQVKLFQDVKADKQAYKQYLSKQNCNAKLGRVRGKKKGGMQSMID